MRARVSALRASARSSSSSGFFFFFKVLFLLFPTRAQLHSVVCVASRPSRSVLMSLCSASYCTLIRAWTRPTRPLLAYTYFSTAPV
ncbi:hypothetical protein BDW75DRAFT_137594 [Aspergillus navahoensis]